MKKIFTLCLLVLSATGFTQNTSPTVQEALKGEMPICGLVKQNPAADTVIISGNCWAKPKRMCDTVNTTDLQKSLAGKLVSLNVVNQDTGKTIRRRSCGGSLMPTDTKPMLLVDGKIVPLPSLEQINPSDIESVEILKPSVTTALFGADGANGAIVITIKRTEHWKIYIKDLYDKAPIAGATISVRNRKSNKPEQLVVNDSGYVLLNRKVYIDTGLIITAVGYQQAKLTYPHHWGIKANITETIFLNPHIKVCEGVVVKAYGTCNGCRRGVCRLCRISGIVITKADSIQKKDFHNIQANPITIYPNPAARNSMVQVKLNTEAGNPSAIRVSNAAGELLLTQKLNLAGKQSLIQVQTGNWPAGVYFIQLLYANGQTAASGRIVIQ